ncbi:ictacalcin-like isoform X1 [Pungitius pungitius]|uniref:ictacalcin-like isoform X1 n=1 Tax=Pungitius pungitius TaxID=134920 RepID=UPI001888E19D|nr:ictacalcin-like isoform X1 [Pungitius pungitius]
MTTCQQGTRRDVGVVGDEKGGRKGGRKVWWTIKHPLHPFPSLHHYSDFYSRSLRISFVSSARHTPEREQPHVSQEESRTNSLGFTTSVETIIMSDIQKAMALLIGVFDKYAGKEGDRHTLTKGELKELLQNEFGDLLGKTNDQAAVDRLFKGLDSNQDNSVDFKEFSNMVSCLTVLCHEHFCKK